MNKPSINNQSVPELSNALFEGMFACVTSALMIGSLADRGRILPAVVFIFVWSTLVYDPIACWTWNPAGWASKLGYLDYAGGTPVHVASGFGALALSFMLGKKIETTDEVVAYRPHSTLFVVLGTAFMWIGWFGFNTGTSLAPTQRAVQAIINTQVSASFGGFTWAIMDYRLAKKWSVVGFCSGIIAGLVAITPAAGYVPVWAAVISGVLGGMAANLGTKLKFFLGIDDSLDVFAVHGLGAIIGNIITGFFASKTIAALDGSTVIDGGWINHNYVQLGYQIAGTVAAAAYSFVVTLIILFILQRIPGLHLRVTPEEEEMGLDFAEHDEFAFDYVELFPQLPMPQADIWASDQRLPNVPNSSLYDDQHNNHSIYQHTHKAGVDLELGTIEISRPPYRQTENNSQYTSAIGPSNATTQEPKSPSTSIFRTMFSTLMSNEKKNRKSSEGSSREQDPGIELTHSISNEKRVHSLPNSHGDIVTPMTNFNRESLPDQGVQQSQYEFQSSKSNPPNSFHDISMFPSREIPATSNHIPLPRQHITPMYTYPESESPRTGGNNGYGHTANSSQISVPTNSLNDISSSLPRNNRHFSPHNTDNYISPNEYHEAIEGSSTYRRIHDQLDFSRWRGRFRHIGGNGGLLSRSNSISTAEEDRYSNLSPTATANVSQSVAVNQNTNAALFQQARKDALISESPEIPSSTISTNNLDPNLSAMSTPPMNSVTQEGSENKV